MPTLLLKDRVQVTDKNLISCLLAVGCLPFGGDHITKLRGDREFDAFEFHLKSEDGRYNTHGLCCVFEDAWADGNTWVDDNPEHPFAYAMMALWNRIQVHKAIKEKSPVAFIGKGRSVAMLEPHMMPRHEQEILRKIGV